MTGSSKWRWLDAAEWDRIAAASPGATPFHARAWSELFAQLDGRFEARALGLVVEGPEPVLLPLLARRGRLRKGVLARAVSTHPGTYGGPIHAARALTEDDWRAVRAGLDQVGIGRLEVFGNPREPIPPQHARGLEVERRETHLIELATLPEDPLESYRASCRRAVRKAERAGVRVARLAEAAEVDDYAAAYRDSLARWGKDPARGYPGALFHALRRTPGVELWGARLADGRLAAGGVFLFAPRHVVYWHGALREELAEERPMNALMHRLIAEARARGAEWFDFNPSRDLPGVTAFKESFGARPRDFLAWRHHHPLRARLRRKRVAPLLRPDPVILLGNQKSGTSAVASLLADLGGLSRTIDVPALWGERGFALMRGRARLAQVVAEDPAPFAVDVIKEPMMTFFVDQVLEVFPDARYAFLVRDPRDNARSLLNSRGLPGNLDELGPEQRAALGRRLTVDPRVWGGADENYVGVLAHRWNLAADAALAQRGRMQVVRYEDFMADKLGFLRGLATALGLEERADVSAALDVQYQPRGDRAVTWLDFFGPANLARIERLCGERMAAFGYELSR